MVTQTEISERADEELDLLEALGAEAPAGGSHDPVAARRAPRRALAALGAAAVAGVAATWAIGGDTAPPRTAAERVELAPVQIEGATAPAPAPKQVRREAPRRTEPAAAAPADPTSRPALAWSGFVPQVSPVDARRAAKRVAERARISPPTDPARARTKPATSKPVPVVAPNPAQQQLPPPPPPPPVATEEIAPAPAAAPEQLADAGQPTRDAAGPTPLDLQPPTQQEKEPPEMGAAGEPGGGVEDPDYVPDEPYVEGEPKLER